MATNQHTIDIGNRDKIFFSQKKYTKGDLIDYYERIAGVMLPHIKDRPLTMIRFPNGIDGKKFYQKDTPDYFPEWIERKEIKKKEGGHTDYIICNSPDCLIYLTNQACITPHIWLSRKDEPDFPDRMIFDLDPSDEDFSKVKAAARHLGKLLMKDLDLPAYLMTTGSRGIHVVTPLKREKHFDQVREFAQAISKYLESQYPDKLTTAVRKNKRDGKLFLDVARNGFGQTTVAPYAVRPLKSAPVATPLDWNELNKSGIISTSYNIRNIFKRLGNKKDPWKDINKNAVSLDSAIKKLEKLKEE